MKKGTTNKPIEAKNLLLVIFCSMGLVIGLGALVTLTNDFKSHPPSTLYIPNPHQMPSPHPIPSSGGPSSATTRVFIKFKSSTPKVVMERVLSSLGGHSRVTKNSNEYFVNTKLLSFDEVTLVIGKEDSVETVRPINIHPFSVQEAVRH